MSIIYIFLRKRFVGSNQMYRGGQILKSGIFHRQGIYLTNILIAIFKITDPVLHSQINEIRFQQIKKYIYL